MSSSRRLLRKAFGSSKVTLGQTEREINALLDKHGIPAYPRQFSHLPEGKNTGEPGQVMVRFTRTSPSGVVIAYRMRVWYEFVPGPNGGNQGSTPESAGRAIYWTLKAKLDSVAWGIDEFEEAFLANIVDPNDPDHTLYENFALNVLALPAGK